MMRRRDLLTGLGTAVIAWPRAARAQHPAAMPVIGVLSAGLSARGAHLRPVLLQSLADTGYVDGRNVTIKYVSSEGHYDRLPALAAELVRDRVTVIVASATAAALAARAATATIPIVFNIPDDPVELGLVTSLARPGGNATGVHFLAAEVRDKQLGLLHELMPGARRIGMLVNPHDGNPEKLEDIRAAAAALSVQVDIVPASDSREIEAAFATLASRQIEALLIGTGVFLYTRRNELAALAARHRMVTVSNAREHAEAGGLMSYGPSLKDAFRQLGAYTGRILNGAKPADLPVVQTVKFELVVNLKTATALGLTVPPSLLAQADEVIE